MRICIETTSLRGPLTGIGEYVYRLIKGLLPLLSEEDVLQGYDSLRCTPLDRQFLKVAAQRSDLQANNPAHSRSGVARRAYLIVRQATLPRHAARWIKQTTFAMAERKSDVFHATNFAPPRPPHIPVLPLLYDLSFIRFPELHPIERVQWLEQHVPMVVDLPFIQTISNFCREEIVQLLGVPSERIHVAYPGIAPIFHGENTKTDEISLATEGLVAGQYFLVVATREPRKNFKTVAEAYLTLPTSVRASFPLVWVGASGWGNLDLSPHVMRALQEGNIRITGYLKKVVLAALYRNTSLFIMPSLYEGFGMPVAEALACQAPIAVSDIPVFREVARSSACYIPAMDVSGWREAMYAASDVRSRGPATDSNHLEQFSWARAAAQSMELYHKLLAKA